MKRTKQIVVTLLIIVLGVGVWFGLRNSNIIKSFRSQQFQEKTSQEQEQSEQSGGRQATVSPSRESSEPTKPSEIEKVLDLEGEESKKTDVFQVSEGEWSIEYAVMRDEYPSSGQNPSWNVSLYKQGDASPVWSRQGQITKEKLEKGGWDPKRVGFLEDQGIVGGLRGNQPNFSGPGKFYFKIRVENIDRWHLIVEEGYSG